MSDVLKEFPMKKISDYEEEFELTTHNALRLLRDSGFQTVKDWYQLTESLEVPLDTRRQLCQQAEKYQNYNIALDYFIRNNQNPSWMTLYKAVEGCDRKVSKNLRDNYKFFSQDYEELCFCLETVMPNEWKSVIEEPVAKVESPCLNWILVLGILFIISPLCWLYNLWIGIGLGFIILLLIQPCNLLHFVVQTMFRTRSDPTNSINHIRKAQNGFGVNTKLTVQTEASKEVIAIASCDGNHQEHYNHHKAVLFLYPVQTVNHKASFTLPHNVELYKAGTTLQPLTCYVSASIQCQQRSEPLYYQMKEGDGYCIHKGDVPNSFWLFFHRPHANYIVELYLEFIVDVHGEIFNFQHNEGSFSFRTTEQELTFPSTCKAVVKLTGFSNNGKYQRLTNYLRKRVLEGIYDHDIESFYESVYSPSSGADEDMKAIVHLYIGFHYQIAMKQLASDEFFTKSKDELEKAIRICDQGNCKNTAYLLGRANIYLTQNSYYAGKFDHTQTYVEKAEEYFLFLPDRHEKSGLVYQRVLLGSIDELNGKQLSDDTITLLGNLMNLAIFYASLDNTYQAWCLKSFMLVKRAMLYLGIFNLTHDNYYDKKLEDYQVKTKWLLEAKYCLQIIPQEFVSTEITEVSFYKGLYFFTLSDCLRHEQHYKESLENLFKAERQFKSCKCRFSQKEIDKRSSFLLEAISTDERRSEAMQLKNVLESL